MVKVQAHRARKSFRKFLEASANRAVAEGEVDDEIEVLRRYAARSGAAAPLQVDVAASVLEAIRRGRDERDWLAGALRPMMMAAAASLLLAVSLGFFAQQAVAELQDPLSSLFTPFVVSLQ